MIVHQKKNFEFIVSEMPIDCLSFPEKGMKSFITFLKDQSLFRMRMVCHLCVQLLIIYYLLEKVSKSIKDKVDDLMLITRKNRVQHLWILPVSLDYFM